MASAGTKFDSLRLSRSEIERLVLVLLLSLALHLLSWGGYELGKKLGWWQELHWPAWLHHAKKVDPIAQVPLQNQEPPLEFVTVNQPSTEAPKNAKYFSNQNSRAANPDADRDTDTPKLNGEQNIAPGSKDELLTHQHDSKTQPMQQASKPQQPMPSQLAMNAGDLKLQKPDNNSQQEKPEPPRPRTIKQALAQQAEHPSVEMQQEGGVRRQAQASLDAKALPYGQYTQEFIDAIIQRWQELVKNQQFALDRTGKVTLQFKLNYDGSISDMTISENSVGYLYAYICEKAVFDNEPYGKWPSDMRLEVGNSFDVRFTFEY